MSSRRLDPAAEAALAVARGVEETVALSRARGQAVVREPGRRAPYRRRSGLDWLSAKGRIGPEARAAGERYGAAYQRAKAEAAIRSSLDATVRGAFRGPGLDEVLARGEATAAAQRALAAYRARLWRHPELVGVCDQVCGEGLTPREFTGDSRTALRVETLLKLALEVLAAG